MEHNIELLLKKIEELQQENKKLKEELGFHKDDSLSNKFRRKYANQVFDALPDMFTICDYDGNLMGLISGEESNHTGAPLNVLFNSNVRDVLDPTSASNLLYSLKRAKKEKKLIVGHHCIPLHQINYQYEHRVIPMDEDYALIICRDTTLVSERDKQILELNYFYKSILNAVPAYIFAKDAEDDFKYIFWNKAFANAIGRNAEDAAGHTDYDIFEDKAVADKFRQDDILLVSQESEIISEELFPAKDNGTRIVNSQKLIIPNINNKKTLVGVAQDITKLKQTEQELKKAKIKAENNDRQKSEFLSNMGHEIKTPVNAICGFSEILTCANTPDEREQYIEIIKSNSKLLIQLINDILDLSKIEAGALEFSNKDIDLGAICHNLYEIHNSHTNKDVKLIYENKGESLPMHGDPNRIMQVINNFLTNACKFTFKGHISMGFSDMGDQIRIHITDTGIGIEEDRLEHIFDRFVKLNSKIQGTGLGLAISQMIVEKMGGTIGVTSKKGEGSSFYFIIPKNGNCNKNN